MVDDQQRLAAAVEGDACRGVERNCIAECALVARRLAPVRREQRNLIRERERDVEIPVTVKGELIGNLEARVLMEDLQIRCARRGDERQPVDRPHIRRAYVS